MRLLLYSLLVAVSAVLQLTGLASARWDKANRITGPRTEAVKNAFRHAWNGYTKYAFGHDELRPLTNGTSDTRYVCPLDSLTCRLESSLISLHML